MPDFATHTLGVLSTAALGRPAGEATVLLVTLAVPLWLAIALHTTPGVPEYLDPEIALVTAGVETDVLEHFDPDFVRDDVVSTILDNGWPE